MLGFAQNAQPNLHQILIVHVDWVEDGTLPHETQQQGELHPD